MAVPLWWLLFGLIFMMLPGKNGINYYICTGENPKNDPYSVNKVRYYFLHSYTAEAKKIRTPKT